MKLGVTADIHGNFPALKAVWAELTETHNVDATVCAGDIVGVLGWPEETVQFVKQNFDYVVYGNHDARVMPSHPFTPVEDFEREEHQLVSSELSSDSVTWLDSLPEKLTIDSDVIVTHAHPFKKPHHGFPAKENDETYLDKRYWTQFGAEYLTGELVIFGHTHEHGGLDVSRFDGQNGVICNPGSVGVPWHTDAHYAIVDTETHTVETHQVSYDSDHFTKRFTELGLK